jgi:hypothetical protein
MPELCTHIVFNKLAENTLRQMLALQGRNEETLVFPDNLSFGLIYPTSIVDRSEWIRTIFYLNPDKWSLHPEKMSKFFEAKNFTTSKKIVWFCQNSVQEVCGFYKCVQNFEPSDFYYIDTMNLAGSTSNQRGRLEKPVAIRLAHINPEMASRLIGQEVPMSDSLRSNLVAEWLILCRENAPFRTIGAEGVVSVPISYFDGLLLAALDSDWRPARLVVTEAAVAASETGFFPVDVIGLTGRLNGMIEQGRVEMDGVFAEPLDMKVRLRSD